MGVTDISIDEIFRMAVELEREGARFYRRAAEQNDDSDTRRLLLDMAADEEEHEKVFAAMGDRFPDDGMDDGLEPTLHAMVEGQVFGVPGDPVQNLTGGETVEEILWTAVRLEKDSVVFYLGLKDLIPDDMDKQWIDNIIREEMKHVADLSRRLAVLRHELQ